MLITKHTEILSSSCTLSSPTKFSFSILFTKKQHFIDQTNKLVFSSLLTGNKVSDLGVILLLNMFLSGRRLVLFDARAVANKRLNRESKKTTTTLAATGTSQNKRFIEKNNGCVPVIILGIFLPLTLQNNSAK